MSWVWGIPHGSQVLETLVEPNQTSQNQLIS